MIVGITHDSDGRVIQRRVARHLSPPPLRRLRNILKVERAAGQVEAENTGEH